METRTFEQHIQDDVADTAARSRLKPEDGVVVSAIKLIASPCRWWHRNILFGVAVPGIRWLVETAYLPLLKLTAVCLGALEDESSAETYEERLLGDDGLPLRNLCLDIYIGFWSVMLLALYSVVWWVAREPELTSCHRCCVIVAALIATWRLYEICAFQGILHSKDRYGTPAKMRAIFNTLWHYGEAVIVFAIFYASLHLLGYDGFSSETPVGQTSEPTAEHLAFAGSVSAPLYFSAVTMTTLGYGDLSPESAPGQFLVSLQVAVGLYLLVVVIQRAMAAQDDEN